MFNNLNPINLARRASLSQKIAKKLQQVETKNNDEVVAPGEDKRRRRGSGNMAKEDDIDHHVEKQTEEQIANCDPLMYRLQHQQQILKEKLELKSSANGGKKKKERDPFDLWGSSESEDGSSDGSPRSLPDNIAASYDKYKPNPQEEGKETNDRIEDRECQIDVYGWGEPTSDNVDECSVENGENGLFVDFGGITPEERRRIADRRKSLGTSDAIHFPDRSKIKTQQQQKKQHAQQERYPSITSKTSKTSCHSSFSSVTNFSRWPDDGTPYYDVEDEDENDGEEKQPHRRASHADLEDILSCLEKEAVTPSTTPTSAHKSSSSAIRSAADPTPKVNRLPTLSSKVSPSNQNPDKRKQDDKEAGQSSSIQPSNNPSLKYSPARRIQEEDENPRLVQLKQSSTEELQLELSNMQSQSKNNLEQSWAETEQMRCENAELDDQLGGIKKKLEVARMNLNAIITVPRRLGRRNSTGRNSFRNSITSYSIELDFDGGKPRTAQINKLRRSLSSRSLGDKSQQGDSFDEDSLDTNDENEVKSVNTTPIQSLFEISTSFLRRNHSADELEALFASDELKDDAALDGANQQSCSSIITSDWDTGLDIETELVNDKSPMTPYYDIHDSSDKPEIDDQIFKKLLSIPVLTKGEDGTAQSGVFYPAPTDEDFDYGEDGEESSAQMDAVSVAASVAMTLASEIVLDDFDFDPLGSLADNGNDCKSVKSDKSVKSAKSDKSVKSAKSDKSFKGLRRRPSLLNIFDGMNGDDNNDDDDDDDNNSIERPPVRSPKVEDDKAAKKSRLERDKEIDKLTKLVRKQEKEVETCEWKIDEVNAKCRENEKKFKKKESILEREVKDLSRRNLETESQLDHLEDAKQEAREKQDLLVKQLDNIGEVCPEKEARIELEKQLSCSKQDFESIQENAIGSLSDLLNDLDTICVPSLRRDAKDCLDSSSSSNGGGVSGDIIARFDDFTDKEEEFVRILSDPERFAACQASLKEIQLKLERALQDGEQLGNLEADLRSHSDTLLTLINGDEGTDTTSSSTASERVSMERVFVEAVISQLDVFNTNQGKVLLNSLPNILQYMTQWQEFLVPDSSSNSPSNAPSSGGEFSSVVEIISMMDGLVKEIEFVVAKAKNIILQEHSRYQGAMNDAGIVSHCSISHAISIRSSKASDSNNNNKQYQTDT